MDENPHLMFQRVGKPDPMDMPDTMNSLLKPHLASGFFGFAVKPQSRNRCRLLVLDLTPPGVVLRPWAHCFVECQNNPIEIGMP